MAEGTLSRRHSNQIGILFVLKVTHIVRPARYEASRPDSVASHAISSQPATLLCSRPLSVAVVLLAAVLSVCGWCFSVGRTFFELLQFKNKLHINLEHTICFRSNRALFRDSISSGPYGSNTTSLWSAPVGRTFF